MGFTHSLGNWKTDVRFNYFGTYIIGDYDTGETAEEANDTYGPNWVTDISVKYAFSDDLSLIVGGQNVFSEYPEEQPERVCLIRYLSILIQTRLLDSTALTSIPKLSTSSKLSKT